MKKIFSTKYLTMVCFLLMLALFFLANFHLFLYGCKVAVWNFLNQGTLDFSTVETQYQDSFYGKALFINLNGGFQRLMGAREINERYRMDNGQMTYVIDEIDTDGFAENTAAFRDALQAMDIPMVYVNTLFKINESDKQLPDSIEDHANENANRFLSVLQENSITYLDLRRSMEEDGLDHYSLFFPTDHHWRPETGFWAAGKITDYLTELDSSFAVEERVTDLSNYALTVYEDAFLGSHGRRVGLLYAGLDDITVITPTFDTEFSFSVPEKSLLREGSFENAFLFMEHLTPDNYLHSKGYSIYCGADYGLLKIRNSSTTYSPTSKKLLLIKDSYSNVIFPFLATGYEEVHVVDLRYLEEDLMTYIKGYQPDLVLVVYNPGAYNTDNVDMFDFLK